MKLKTVIGTVNREQLYDCMEDLFEKVDIEIKKDYLDEVICHVVERDEDNNIDFLTEDIIVRYMSGLGLKNDTDYSFGIYDSEEEKEYSIVSLTINKEANKDKAFNVYSWSNSSIIVGGEKGDVELNGAYVLLENNLGEDNKESALNYVTKTYGIDEEDLFIDEIVQN